MQYNKPTNETILAALSGQFRTFHQTLNKRNVACQHTTPVKTDLPEVGLSFEALDKLISAEVVPNLSASNGGRYWGFVTGGANPVATYADWLVTTFNQNVSKGGDSIASDIELQTLSWLCELFSLPRSFNGIFTTGATAANVLAAFTARQYAGLQQNIDITKSGMAGLDVNIFSATPHASMIKSLGFAGFGQNSWQKIPCNPDTEAMDIHALEAKLVACTARSKIVIASAATVTGTDFDDIAAIATLCEKYHAWLHVDAAFGIFERLVNPVNGKTHGIERADSITLDCHKWLNVPYDCGVFLTQHMDLLAQCCEVSAPYLANPENSLSYMSLGIENSRRFRAFPVWATLLAYGKQGITHNIKANMRQASVLAQWLEQSDKYELLKPCELNVVLFKPNTAVLGLTSAECLAKLNASGQVFLTPGAWQGQAIIRAALSNWATSDEDVQQVISTLNQL
ncbi:aminotransferase class I/II-fold pyridoxal phosphate-dependent enzyme [Paraglaciecola sp.]|uniref:pyridoxal phosphate-dependent decarboxylase family protein n=1 Tax=Paraglaciecola sp. TaxID=1920173 RepID=UPI0030F378DE